MFFKKYKDANLYKKLEEIRTHKKHAVKKSNKYLPDCSTIPGYTVILIIKGIK